MSRLRVRSAWKRTSLTILPVAFGCCAVYGLHVMWRHVVDTLGTVPRWLSVLYSLGLVASCVGAVCVALVKSGVLRRRTDSHVLNTQRWYIQTRGRIVGPRSYLDLVKLHDQGELDLGTKVREGGEESPWRPFEAVLQGVVNCTRFAFVCPKQWNGLGPTDDPLVRHCDDCHRDVHSCYSVEELEDQARLGRCAAFFVTERVVLLGVPEAPPEPFAGS